MSDKISSLKHRHTAMARTILNALYSGDSIWLYDENTIIIDHVSLEFGSGTKTLRTTITIDTKEL